MSIRYPVRVTTTTARGGYKLLDADQHEICYGYRHHQMTEIAAALNAANDMRDMLDRLIDPDPCRLDHHGNCQAHGLGNPCEMRLARELLERIGHPLPAPPDEEVGR